MVAALNFFLWALSDAELNVESADAPPGLYERSRIVDVRQEMADVGVPALRTVGAELLVVGGDLDSHGSSNKKPARLVPERVWGVGLGLV